MNRGIKMAFPFSITYFLSLCHLLYFNQLDIVDFTYLFMSGSRWRTSSSDVERVVIIMFERLDSDSDATSRYLETFPIEKFLYGLSYPTRSYFVTGHHQQGYALLYQIFNHHIAHIWLWGLYLVFGYQNDCHGGYTELRICVSQRHLFKECFIIDNFYYNPIILTGLSSVAKLKVTELTQNEEM